MRYWDQSWLCGPGSYFHGPFGFFLNLAFWLGLFLLVFWLLGNLASGRNRHDQQDSTAIDILKRRYAAGEIERNEFEQKLQDLR